MAEPPREGYLLSAPGEYQETIRRLSSSDPRLRQFDPKKIRQQTQYPSKGTRVIAMPSLGNPGEWGDSKTFLEGGSLREHLDATKNKKDQKWTYILEGLGPDFVHHLGVHFKIHPGMFFDHERVVVFDDNPRSGDSDSPPLPSILCTRNHYTLNYYETLYLFRKPPHYRLFCKSTGRQIAATRFNGQFNNVGLVRRKVTVWCRTHENGNWDCLVICDPPLKEVGYLLYESKAAPKFAKVKPEQYQGGYRDFVPEDAQMLLAGQGGPPRTSMAEDLEFYLRSHSKTVGGVLDGPDLVSMFVQKLVASHYIQLSEYLRSTFSVTQRNYQRQQDFSNDEQFGVDATEKQWSDVQTWERRVGEYCSNIETAMLQLRIPMVDQIDYSSIKHWTDVTRDYQNLHSKFRELRSTVAAISIAVTGLTGIAGNRQASREQHMSIIEARNSRVLSTLGFVFLPLLFAAGLLSMNEIFLPGGDEFWKYWVIAVPLMYVFMFVVRFAIHKGYKKDNPTHWSVKTLWGNVAQNFRCWRGRKRDQEETPV